MQITDSHHYTIYHIVQANLRCSISRSYGSVRSIRGSSSTNHKIRSMFWQFCIRNKQCKLSWNRKKILCYYLPKIQLLNSKCFTHFMLHFYSCGWTILHILSLVFCCYQQVYDIFNTSCLGMILGRDGMSAPQNDMMHTHSLMYHVFARVVSLCLSCSFVFLNVLLLW